MVIVLFLWPLIKDNAKNLNNKIMDELCEQFKINHRNSTSYCPKMNEVVEAANKNIKRIIEKMTTTYKDWHEICRFRSMDITPQFVLQQGQHHFLWFMVWKMSYL